MSDFAIPPDEMKPEFVEFEKENRAVLEDPDDFDAWERLVRIAESLEGGLNRNSSPQAIALTRNVFDRFLAKFPLLFGYWKKYADLEFSIAGTEAAEMVRVFLRDIWPFTDALLRSTNAVSPASESRSTSGPTTVRSKSKPVTIQTSSESKFCYLLLQQSVYMARPCSV
jgi:hypothetical protein